MPLLVVCSSRTLPVHTCLCWHLSDKHQPYTVTQCKLLARLEVVKSISTIDLLRLGLRRHLQNMLHGISVGRVRLRWSASVPTLVCSQPFSSHRSRNQLTCISYPWEGLSDLVLIKAIGNAALLSQIDLSTAKDQMCVAFTCHDGCWQVFTLCIVARKYAVRNHEEDAPTKSCAYFASKLASYTEVYTFMGTLLCGIVSDCGHFEPVRLRGA